MQNVVRRQTDRIPRFFQSSFAWTALIGIMVLFYFDNTRNDFSYLPLDLFDPLVLVPAGLFSVLIFKEKALPKFLRESTLVILGILALSCIEVFCYVNTGDFTGNWHLYGSTNFNTVFHVIAQVAQGGTVLTDLYSQYGLYAEFLNPIVRLIGLEPHRFVTLMVFLNLAVYSGFIVFLRTAISPLLTAVTILSTAYFSFFLRAASYFPNHPIRIAFSAPVFLLVALYLRTRADGLRSFKIYHALFFLTSAATFWNFDTGALLIFSWSLLLAFEEISAQAPSRETLAKILRHFATAFLYMAGGAAALTLKSTISSQQIPSFSQIFRFQNLFFVHASMVPSLLPTFHLWHFVILAYAAGIAFALQFQNHSHPTKKWMPGLVLFISLYGLGYFSYCMMRGSDPVMMYVMYPAIFLVGIFASEILDSEATLTYPKRVLSLSLIFLLTLTSFGSFAASLRLWKDHDQKAYQTFYPGKAGPFFDHTKLITSLHYPDGKAVFISEFSGIWHAYTKTVNPIKVPGPSELLLEEDFVTIDSYLKKALEKKESITVVVDHGAQALGMGMSQYFVPIAKRLAESFKKQSSTADGEVEVFTNP